MSVPQQGLDHTPATMQLNRWTAACSFQKHLYNVVGYSKENSQFLSPLVPESSKRVRGKKKKKSTPTLCQAPCQVLYNHHLMKSSQELSELDISMPILQMRKLEPRE